MNIISKIALISFVFIVLSLLLKTHTPEFVFLFAFIALLFSFIVDYLSSFISNIITIFTSFNIESEHISLLFKVVAITIIGDLVSDSLNDNGEATIGNVVILITKFVVIFMTMPLINSLVLFCLKFIT